MAEIHDIHTIDRRVIEEFRANGGVVGGQFAGAPILLLTTMGAKSGEPRTRPLAYLPEGGRIYVFAGNRGGPTDPAWYRNLLAHPDVMVEIGAEQFAARAIVVDGAEAERLRDLQAQRIPGLADLLRKLARTIPVVLLERKQ